jgi:hypothetical protein
MSSLLLPIQMMTLPDNRGRVGELPGSVALPQEGPVFFDITPRNMANLPYFVKSYFGIEGC